MKAGEINSRFWIGLMDPSLRERAELFCHFGKALHQSAFAPGSIVLVDNTLLRGSVKEAYGGQGCFLSDVFIAFNDGGICFRYQGPGTPAVHTVMDAAFFILPVAFDL